MKLIRQLIKKTFFPETNAAKPEKPTCKDYMEKIERLPDPLPNQLFCIDKCINCLEKIPGILDPLEGYALFELAKSGNASDPIAEVGSYLGKSASYMALGSLVAGKKGVVAIDMFPAKEDWFKGEDGLWHIHGSDYYLSESVYKEREHFFYGGSHYANTLDIFNDIVGKVNIRSHITAFKGNSSAYMEKPGRHAKFRMVFIDGDHTYQGVKKDIEALSGAIVPGGYICFHDYCSSFPGVIKAVDELILSSSAYQQRCLVRSLAVARKA